MKLLLVAMTLMAACSPRTSRYERTDEYARPDRGAILSVQLKTVAAADRLMDDVQSTLFAHPEWTGQTAYYGFDPPSGFTYKFECRCAARPPAALAVERLMGQAEAGTPRCQEVGY